MARVAQRPSATRRYRRIAVADTPLGGQCLVIIVRAAIDDCHDVGPPAVREYQAEAHFLFGFERLRNPSEFNPEVEAGKVDGLERRDAERGKENDTPCAHARHDGSAARYAALNAEQIELVGRVVVKAEQQKHDARRWSRPQHGMIDIDHEARIGMGDGDRRHKGDGQRYESSGA